MAGLNLKVGINVLQATRELRSLSKSIGQIGVAAAKANKSAGGLEGAFGAIGTSIRGFSGLLVQATGALAVFGAGAAAKSALEFTAEFEKNLADINTILGDGGVSIQQYEKQLLDLSTQSSKTLDDLSRGLYQTISAGIPAVEGASGAFAVLEASQQAAVAGLASTESAVDATVSVLNAYGQESFFASEVTDKLLTTVRLGRVRFDELAKGIGRVAPIAASAGVALDDVLAVFIQLTRQGIKPAEAITGLRNILKTLVRPTSKSTKTVEALNKELAKVGSEQIRLGAGILRQDGLIGVLRNLTQATGGSTAALAEIFPNVRALIPAIVSVGEGFETTVGFQKELINSSGATKDAFEKVNKTFSETFARLLSNIGRVAAIGFGDILDDLNVKLQEFSTVLSDEDGIKSFKSGLDSAYGALKDILGIVVALTEALKILAVAVLSLGSVAILGGIVSFGAAFAEYKAIGAGVYFLRNSILGLLGALPAKLGAAKVAAAGLGASLGGIVAAIGAPIAAAFTSLFVLVDQLIEQGPLVKDVGDLFSEAFSAFGRGDLFSGSMGVLVASFVSLADAVGRVSAKIAQIVAGLGVGIFRLLGADELAESWLRFARLLERVADEGLVAVAAEFSVAVAEARSLKKQIDRTEKSANILAESLGFRDAKEQFEFLREVWSGGRVDLGELLVTASDLDSVVESSLAFVNVMGEDGKKALEGLTPVIEEFFLKFNAGAKTSQLSAKMLFEKLRAEIQGTGAKLSEFEITGIAFGGAFGAFSNQLETVNADIESIQGELVENDNKRLQIQQGLLKGDLEALAITQARLQTELDYRKSEREGIENQLNGLNGIDQENEKRRETAEIALKKAKQKKEGNKRQKALNDLLKIESNLLKEIAKAQAEIIGTRERLLEIDILRLETSRELSKEGRDEAFESLKKLNTLRDTAKLDSAREKFISNTRDAIESITGNATIPGAESLISGQLFEERQRALIELQKIIAEQQAKRLETQEKIKDTERKIAQIRKAAPGLSTVRAKQLLSQLEVLKATLAELDSGAEIGEARSRSKKRIDDLKRVEGELRKSLSRFSDLENKRTADLFESNTANLLQGVKRRNKAFLDSFESDLDRKDFKAKLEFVSAARGISIDEALSVLRRDIRERLSNLGIDQEDISRPLFDAIRSLKAVGAPQELAEFARVAISDFNIAISSGTAEEINKAKQLIETRVKALKEALKDTPEAAEFLRSLDDNVKKAVGPTAQMAVNLADAAAATVSLTTAFEEFANESELVPGKIFDSTFQALGDLSFNFGEKIAGAIGSSVSKLPAVFQAGRALIDASLRDAFFVKLNNESGFIRGVAGGIVGAANLFVRVTGEGVLAVANLFVKTIGDILTPIGTAIAAPVERLLGSLGAAVGVLADTPEEEDRRDRKEALELQRATLAQLQRSGASNDQIAQEQAALAALLRSQQGDEPQTAAERLEEEINRSVQAALNIAEQLGPLVTQFFQTVTEKLPEVFPLLVKGLVEALDAFGEYFPQFFEILVQEVVDALPDIIAAVIRLIPRIIEALARGLFALIRGLPGILLGVFRGIAEAISIGILKSLGDGIKRIFSDIGDIASGGGTLGRVARGVLTLGISEAFEENPFGISFHTGGNVTSGMKNKSLASQYRAAGVQGFLDGGMVGDTLRRNFRASMSDDVPALLQTGEAVLNRAAVSNIGGPSAVDAINSGAGVAPNLNVNVGINPNANGLGQAAAALLPFLIGSISVAGPGSKPSSQNLMGFRGIGGAPLIRQS